MTISLDSSLLFSSLLLLLLSHFSRVRLCATPEMAAQQAPPSLGFSRQEHWSGLPFPSPMHESEKWKWSCSVEVAQSCPTLSDPMDCSLPSSSNQGIFQARVLEWGAIAFSSFPNLWLLINSRNFSHLYSSFTDTSSSNTHMYTLTCTYTQIHAHTWVPLHDVHQLVMTPQPTIPLVEQRLVNLPACTTFIDLFLSCSPPFLHGNCNNINTSLCLCFIIHNIYKQLWDTDRNKWYR